MKNVRKMVLASLFASLTAVCAWLAIPIPPVAVTMQTFAILLALGTLGGMWGSVSILLYLGLGVVGLPVFAGFRGGASALLDPTGGFLWGFLLSALLYWLLERLGKLPAMVASLAGCYFCGCLWFRVYSGGMDLGSVFLVCVAPYLIPDGLKLWLAHTLSTRLRRHIHQ